MERLRSIQSRRLRRGQEVQAFALQQLQRRKYRSLLCIGQLVESDHGARGGI